MIEVRWQGRNSPDRIPDHGFDFDEHTGVNVLYDPDMRHPMPEHMKHWVNYAVHLSEQRLGCLRIWVDSEIVWDYQNGWYYDLSDLRARIWRSDARPSPEATDVQDKDERSSREG